MNLRILPFLSLSLLFFLAGTLYANEIEVSNISLTGQNTDDGFVLIQFDLSWENSWRVNDGPQNWDAAWVFVKYRTEGSGVWNHAYLNNSGHSAGSGTSALVQTGLIDEDQPFDITTNPGMGAFIYRSDTGNGTFSASGVQLKWNYAANGVGDTDVVDVQVFATEMVHIPEGSFFVGDGGTDGNKFYEGGSPGTPFQISSEDEIEVGDSPGQIFFDALGIPNIDQNNPIPASFPKGYQGFYMMKYSVTQQQYVDYLNTLTPSQAENRVDSFFLESTNADLRRRNKLTLVDGLYETQVPFVPLHRVSARNSWAYASWSSMRIMTELEYEKAARGPITPEEGEYAWGTIQINTDRYEVGNQDQVDEFIAANYNENRGNALYWDTQFFVDGEGDLLGSGGGRVGIFATETSNRVQSGASYYGVMELSGNVGEFVVSSANSWERQVTGIHGDGSLDSEGGHTFSIGEIEFGSMKGGGFDNQDLPVMQTSWREFIAIEASDFFDVYTANAEGWGFRTVRTAPSTPAE